MGDGVGQTLVHRKLVLVGVVVDQHLFDFTNSLTWIQTLLMKKKHY